MHREIGAALAHRALELFHEQAFAAGLVEPPVDQLVAARAEGKQVDLQPAVQLLQPLLDVLGLPQRKTAAARGDHQLLHVTMSRSSGHCRRLTGSRSSRPSSTTSQCASSSALGARSKLRIAARATRQLRWIRTKRSANSRSSAISGSSTRYSRSRVRTVTYFCSARRNRTSRTGTSTMRLRSATERYSRGASAALASCSCAGTAALRNAAARRSARTGLSR